VLWLSIGVAVSIAVDYFRQPALPQNFSATALQTLDGEPVDLAAMSRDRPLLVYVWATWCGVCRYTTRGGDACRRGRQRNVRCAALWR
jgi:thiol-disulfide isomerase/thioredoxin